MKNSTMRLQLKQREAKLVDVNIALERPQASSLLIGKRPDVVKMLVPMLFSLCAQAQTIAAKLALDAAMGVVYSEHARSKLAFQVKQEVAAEHGWRLFLDWPRMFGIPALERSCAQYRRLVLLASNHDELRPSIIDLWQILMMLPMQVFLCFSVPEWESWLQQSEAPMARIFTQLRALQMRSKESAGYLVETTAKDWAMMDGALMSLQYCRLPHKASRPLQTGAWVRRAKSGLVSGLVAQGRFVEARLVAKLVELAQYATQPEESAMTWVDACQLQAGVGVARVETSRGTLVHQVRIEQGLVREYAVLAPTEWNFHPQGAFTQEIKSMSASPRSMTERAKILALSLDPCVAFEVETAYA